MIKTDRLDFFTVLLELDCTVKLVNQPINYILFILV